MSLNKLRLYSMKSQRALMTFLLSCSFLTCVPFAQAEEDCQIMSSIKLIDYGNFRRETMNAGSTTYDGISYSGYASVSRELQVSVICPEERKVRLFVDGPARAGAAYRFSDDGAMSIRLKDARVDGTSVQLASVPRGAVQIQGSTAEITLKPDMTAVAVNGQEVAGKQFTVTMDITTYLSDKAFRTRDMKEIDESYIVAFDAQ